MSQREKHWHNWPDNKLLSLKACDLDLSLDDAPDFLKTCIATLEGELEANGIPFRPHYWISDEWFTPDDIPGIAIPFFLFHPALMQLERNQMFDLEGGTPESCMRILRHECGHAIENAYELRRKRSVPKLFGRSSKAYPETYSPRPYSKRFVLHLDSWYAQSHPDEDFAETFAVWLTPGLDWRKRYAGWPALKKLELIDQLMKEIRGKKPPNRSKKRIDPIQNLKITLKEFYHQRIDHYGLNYPDFYDRDLSRLFCVASASPNNIRAANFLRKYQKEIRRHVAKWTETYQYLIDSTINDMAKRCDELDLCLRDEEQKALMDFKLLIAVQTMNFLHSGEHRVAL